MGEGVRMGEAGAVVPGAMMAACPRPLSWPLPLWALSVPSDTAVPGKCPLGLRQKLERGEGASG
jgi:hypothetical protein